jgi:hypothetical protein
MPALRRVLLNSAPAPITAGKRNRKRRRFSLFIQSVLSLHGNLFNPPHKTFIFKWLLDGRLIMLKVHQD